MSEALTAVDRGIDDADYARLWAAATPYLRVRSNDVHVPLSFGYAQRLLEHYAGAVADVVLVAELLHDIGWAVVDHGAADRGGAQMLDPELQVAHERAGAELAHRILSDLGHPAELRDEVVAIIDGHDTRTRPISRNDELVKDADKLWRPHRRRDRRRLPVVRSDAGRVCRSRPADHPIVVHRPRARHRPRAARRYPAPPALRRAGGRSDPRARREIDVSVQSPQGTQASKERRFPSPFEIETPPGAEGWESMYPPYLLFSEENREWEEGAFFFYDGLHRPDIEYPFDTIVHEAWNIALGAFSSHVFLIPGARGLVNRILNGRLYSSTVAVTDPAEIEQRVPIFTERAGFYYSRWDELFGRWRTKMEAVTRELQALRIPDLPEVEDASITTQATGRSSAYELLHSYSEMIESVFLAYQYHFEMHLFGYGAYLNLFQFCKQAFPGIDDQTVANMAAGTEILMFRPDDELKKLARLAIDLGVDDELTASRAPEQTVQRLREDDRARAWIEAFDGAQDPWFHFSSGTGLYHNERSWVDDLSTPWPVMQSYVERLRNGENIDRPREEILERRERLTREYAKLLPGEEERDAFVQNVELARQVAAYVEDHNFYIEHWHHTVFWNKMREIGALATDRGFLHEPDDVFMLNRWEVGQTLYDIVSVWSSGGPGRPAHWRELAASRKPILEALRAWAPEPALGPVPDEITEPFTVMLWGITDERVSEWLSNSDGESGEIKGFAGSPGVVEGTARILHSASELSAVEDGEIIVCPVTAPSWGPVFGRIAAAVTDTGGIMCHAAIVCREYGLPAVVGTGRGTHRIRTGDRIRVDGGTGVVTVLEPVGGGAA